VSGGPAGRAGRRTPGRSRSGKGSGDGTGSGGRAGNGTGYGAGSGQGNGQGNGQGSARRNGSGNGNGSGTGSGTGAGTGSGAGGGDRHGTGGGKGRGERPLRILADLTTFGLFLVIAMGSLVTNTDSGRGCGGTWPLCDGRFEPGPALASLIEFSHRSVASFVGLMTAALAIWVWIAVKRSRVRILAGIGLLFVVVQGLLGAADVMWPESAGVLSLHYGFALISFAGVLLVALELRTPPERPPAPRSLRRLAWVTLAYTYGLVYLGAYVAHSGDTAGCQGWPLCNGQLIPIPMHGATLVAFSHRLAALGLLALVAWLVAAAHRSGRRDLHQAAHLAAVLVVLQALSGAWIVSSAISLASELTHGSLIALLFGCLTYIPLAAGSARAPSASPAVPGARHSGLRTR
jgi:cytochrome c oxidase assembly protein subunit 15